MNRVTPCPLPEEALLQKYAEPPSTDSQGAYTDCFAIDIDAPVAIGEFVLAFYTTPVFRLERLILRIAAGRPSTDTQAQQLADGVVDKFAAWHVEARASGQLLMCDFRARTRSWFMVASLDSGDGPRTRLYFGSAVVPVTDRRTGERRTGAVMRALLGFHKLYSRVLLRCAHRRLVRHRPLRL